MMISRCQLARSAALCIVLAMTRGALAQSEEPDSRDRALDLLEESAALYEQSRFAEAAVLLRRAHELHPEPALLFNLGQALEGAGEPDGALDAYRAYLEADPEGERVAAAAERIAALTPPAPVVTTQAEPALPPVEVRQPAEPAVPERRAGPWVLLGAGIAVVVAGGVVGGLALSRDAEAEDPATSQLRAPELDEQATRLALAADILIGAGIAVAVTAIVWAVVRPRTRERGSIVSVWRF